MSFMNTTKHADFNRGPRLNGFEAWRRLVVPVKPRNEAKRLDMHTTVHNPGKSTGLGAMAKDIEKWEEDIEEYEACGGAITEADRKAVILKMLPKDSPSNVVTNLRGASDLEDPKQRLEDEVEFLREFG